MSQVPHPVPESLSDLFFSFTRLALQGFGGVLAFMERMLVEQKQWMTREEFVQEWAVARTMPGPPAMNLSIMVGAKYFGWRGSLVAAAGMLAAPSITIVVLGLVYAQFGDQPQVNQALRAMGAVAAGFIMATGIKLLTALQKNPLGIRVCAALAAAGFITIAWLHLHSILVLAVLGLVGSSLAYSKIKT